MGLLGDHPSMERFRARLNVVAGTPLPVLIVGETGTGKEVAARSLHRASGRTGPFVPVDCAAMSPQLVESELFGHVRGAFTGATRDRAGLVRAAEGGTFFLDEIADLPLPTQTRLLRLLQESTYRPVGSETERRADIRVVAATWKGLAQAVEQGTFRRDLYHRLAVIELHLPPLRKRGGDVELLAEHFLDAAAQRTGRPAPKLGAGLRTHLRRWPWPGNVRELRNAMDVVHAMSQRGRATVDDLPKRLRGALPSPRAEVGPFAHEMRLDLPYMEARRQVLDAFQLRYVAALLDAHDGNISAAARAADMDRRSIQRILASVRDGTNDDESG